MTDSDLHNIILNQMTGTLEGADCVNHKEAHQYLQLKVINTKFLGYLSTCCNTNKAEAV